MIKVHVLEPYTGKAVGEMMRCLGFASCNKGAGEVDEDTGNAQPAAR